MYSLAVDSGGQVQVSFIGILILSMEKNGVLTLRLDGSGFNTDISDNAQLCFYGQFTSQATRVKGDEDRSDSRRQSKIE